MASSLQNFGFSSCSSIGFRDSLQELSMTFWLFSSHLSLSLILSCRPCRILVSPIILQLDFYFKKSRWNFLYLFYYLQFHSKLSICIWIYLFFFDTIHVLYFKYSSLHSSFSILILSHSFNLVESTSSMTVSLLFGYCLWARVYFFSCHKAQLLFEIFLLCLLLLSLDSKSFIIFLTFTFRLRAQTISSSDFLIGSDSLRKLLVSWLTKILMP